MWYSATLVFRSHIAGETSLRPLCEERVVVFDVANEHQALKAAERYGRREAHSYPNVDGEQVSWQLAGIDNVHAISAPLPEGWEVAAKFVRRSWSTLRKLARQS
jgi:hypothetical protein